MLPVSNKATRELDPGAARSARERRRAERAARAERSGHPLRGLLSRTSDRTAAIDDDDAAQVAPTARLAEQLQRQCGAGVVLMHHRRTPRVRPHIDHLVISPSGVWIVHGRSKQGRVATRKPMFGDPKFTIGGRERTDLLLNLDRQVGYVQAVLAKTHADVQVRSAICFVDTEAPLVRTLFLGSYLFFGSPALATHLNSDGHLTRGRISELAPLLEERFPAA